MGISKILVIGSVLSLTSYALAIPLDDLLRQPREIIRRQYSGYTNNILHQNPNNPDQTAESSVKVSFNPNEFDQKALNQQYDGINYHQQQHQQSVQDYVQQQQAQSQIQSDNNPQSQLFNVGYSVSFTNGQQIKAPLPIQSKYSRAGGVLDDGEIITGTRKHNEEVQLPYDMSPQEYVSAALIDSKKHKISGIKPKTKYQSISNYPNPKISLSQANLSPKTQKYYKVLEHVKTPPPTNTQDFQKYSWRHLSPGVEIIKSTEVPVVNNNQKYAQKIQTPSNFDHARALTRSQDFDYTNAVDLQNQQTQQDNQNSFYNQFGNAKSQVLPVASATTSQKHQVPPPAYVKVKIPKLPMDTSLLRSKPVLTTNLQADLNNNPAVIPIRIDTRLIHEAVMKEIAASSNYVQKLPQQSSVEDLRGYRTIEQDQSPLNYPYGQGDDGDYQQSQSRYPYKFYVNGQSAGIGRYAQSQADGQRQPRFTPEYSLQTDLRPPPVALLGGNNNYPKISGVSYKN